MRKLLLLLFCIVSLHSFSQQYGNEWIDYSQKYYKIAVTAKGIYRVTFSDMSVAGVPVGDIIPSNLQLFYKGQQQYIYVNGEADGVLNGGDYLEFYGEPNNGWFDSTFYNDPKQLVNPNYSLVNDTAYYFLTWSNSTNGKRMTVENDVSFNSYTAIDYCMREVRQDYLSYYNSTEEGCYYNDGEGYVNDYFDYNEAVHSLKREKTIATPNYISTPVNTKVTYCIVGANSLNHSIRISGLGAVIDTSYSGYITINNSFTTSIKIAQNSTLSAKSLSTNTDKNAWAWISILYSHSMDFENEGYFQFGLPKISASKYRLDITNFNGDAGTVFYDITNHKRIIPSKNGSNFQALLTNEGDSPNCILTSGLQILSPVSIKPVSSKNSTTAMFADLKTQKAQYIIITNKKLWNKANEYANYRKLKGFNVVLLDVDELYNQFGYGITKHPGAIRNFCKYALKYSPVKPEYLFVIGKSYHTKLYRNNPSLFNQCLVPSAGNPSSDALLTWKLSGTSYAPALATGRLAALTDADIDSYMNKVREYESAPGAAWMKNVLQFSGGSNAEEELTMRSHIMGYQRIFEAPLFGANVQNFYKNSSLPIANAQSDIIKQSINNGVSILCFFGHASAGGFDQNIDLPSSYDNKGKYPFLMANSCYSGDINNTGLPGISEQWVMIKDRGTIGFLANVDLGYDYYLDLFSSQLVTNISSTNYQGTIGKSILNSIQYLEKQDQSSSLIKLTSLDLILHGDPALKTNGFAKPDLVADVKYISFKPAIISTDIDSFQVKYVVVNEGRAFTDTFSVQVKRTFPNGKTNFLNFKVPGVRSRDTLSFYLPIGGILAAGMNKLEIFLDKNDTISEINEANNSLNYSFIVISTDLIPVYPYKYAIFPNDTVTFIACCPNPYVKYRTAKCQLDVSAKFDSPSLLTAATEYNNGYFTCKMPIRFVANQVYYWRVAIDKGDGNLKWNSSSFIYIPGKTGWSQADFYQFNEDDYKYLSWNEQFKNFNFINSPVRLFCSTKGNLSSEAEWNYVKYTMDGGMKSWSSCGVAAAFNVAVLDSSTLIPWPSNQSDYRRWSLHILACHTELTP